MSKALERGNKPPKEKRCLYTIRRNTPNLKPWEKPPAVKYFLTYSEASAYLENRADRDQLHITVDYE